MTEDSRIRILGFNCWGLKFIAKNLDARIEAIAEALANSNYDIITLQEIWVFAHYERIQARVAEKLPHSKFYYSGALGAGLAILSRFPIVSTHTWPYSLNGEPLDVAAGDWFVGKAALYAKGGEDGPEYRRAHRLIGAWEFAKLARQAAELGRYVIAMGDFNSIPPTLPMTVILDHSSLTDAWVVTHPNVDSNAITTALEAVQHLGITADSPLNTWSAAKGYTSGWGKRLDYCLYRQPVRHGQAIPILTAIDTKVVLTDPVPGQTYSYSDHFGLEATLEITQPDPLVPVTQPPVRELSNATIATIIEALTGCYRNSRVRSRRELIIFGLSLVILLGVAVGTAWLPHAWINPIFIVFTILMSWLATTMLYEGFIFGNWECNTLTGVIEELEIHRKGQEILSGRSGE